MHAGARILVLISAASALAACGAGSSGGAGGAGLYGTVRVHPGTPVCRAGTSCTRPAAGFRLVFVRNGAPAGRATADDRGRYRIRLAPGRYLVRTTGEASVRGVRPAAATVPSGRFARLDFTYDAGIR
jgi:hypothetical protein